MQYASEKFTRSVILYMARTINVQDLRASVERGSLSSSSLKDRKEYFRFGSGIFITLGVLTVLFPIIGVVVLTLVFHIGAGLFFCYAPGLVLYCIGITLDMKERSAAKNIDVYFNHRSLKLSCLSGILMALFIASFSVMDYIK